MNAKHVFLYCHFILETVLPQLLNALCSGNLTPVEHLEKQQVWLMNEEYM